jgi:hypothetical protein
MSADLILMRPKDGRVALIPATAHDMEEFTSAISPGADVRAVLTQSRSLPEHRFYWGLLGKVVENHPFYKSTRPLHIWLKVKMGIVDKIECHDGRVLMHVGSTSFEKMDGIKFHQYLKTSIDLIVMEVLPGIKRQDLIRAVEEMLGMTIPLKAAA